MARSDEFNRPKITNLSDFTTNRDGTGKQSYNFTITERNSKAAEYYQHQDKSDYRSTNTPNNLNTVQEVGAEAEVSKTQAAQALTNSANSFVRTHLTTVAVVATTVTTSVLTIINMPVTLDVSLYSATDQSLIFDVNLALDKEQENHNFFMATLSHEDEKYEQEIMDGVYLVFEQLYPETEYELEILEYDYSEPSRDNTDVVDSNNENPETYLEPELNIISRYKATYRTLKKEEEQYNCFVEGFIEKKGLLNFMVFMENEENKDIFYTATVTDASGKKLAAFDSTENQASYQVDIGESEIVYISVKINNKLVAFQTVYQENRETYGFDYSNITWTWDGIVATAYVPNYDFNEEGVSLNAEVSLRDSYEASCVSEGYDIYVATIYDEYGYAYTDEHEIITSEALGHSYETNWIWNEDGNGASLYLYCAVCGSYEYVEAVVEMSSESPATCEEDGYVIYNGSAEYEGITYTDTHEITLTAYGHAYKEEWSWNEDNEATLTLTCQTCNESHELSATVTSEEVAVSCDNDGSITYNATATYDGLTYSDQKVLITEQAYGHSYETNWNWASDYSSATLTLTCVRGDVNETIVATVAIDTENSQEASCDLEGNRVYIATATYGEETFTDTANENLMPLEHDYQESWEWTANTSSADGGYEATLFMTCNNCGDVIPLTAEVSIESEIEVGCENDGSITYKATVLYQDVEYTDTKTVVTETALGHNYQANWSWEDDGNGTPTAAHLYLFCEACETEVGPIDGTITSEQVSVTGSDPITVYTAKATYDGIEYSATYDG